MSLKYKAIITVLAIVALVMGGGILYQIFGTDMMKNSPAGHNKNSDGLTEEQKALFFTLGEDTTEEEMIDYSNLVRRLAVPGDMVTINNCVASPEVLKIKFGDKLTINNEGTSDFYFSAGGTGTHITPGNKSAIVTNFKNGAGIYTYDCDDPRLGRAIGVLMLTP
jgi:hypothetical protein